MIKSCLSVLVSGYKGDNSENGLMMTNLSSIIESDFTSFSIVLSNILRIDYDFC